ncbi:NAD(P)-binding domain-containing protein [Salinispora arenicola]|uniref:flavin-containing monooxygenase n=1 Tax=Salinispora arenicola TaxID=168697 RepID=UPI001430B960|nr:NAD(P)/FAD-dependent oxidoreductase [Salinispora arenicola]NIL43212.1 NAD(P)-binding domain-containing protein [Salinispora arenicola]
MTVEHHPVVVVGGGQAGLVTGYHLRRRGCGFLILDAGGTVGHAWRSRWDALRLFTPNSYNGLPGLPFPGPRSGLPGKDAVADYLHRYAAHFDLPVRVGARVDGLDRDGDGFLITAGDLRVRAHAVVIAAGAAIRPRVPEFADLLSADTVQLHSADYRNPGQLRDGPVLVVGAGNSGAEIALDVATGHRVTLAGRDTGRMPIRPGSLGYRMMSRLLAVDTPFGRRMLRNSGNWSRKGTPLVRITPKDLEQAGVRRTGRVVGVEDGTPVVDGGELIESANVLWCTGFDQEYPWVKLPAFDEEGRPRHHRGVVETVPGLYFVGLPFQSAMSSSLIGGVGADAAYIAERACVTAAQR